MSGGCNPISRDDMPYIRWIHTIFGFFFFFFFFSFFSFFFFFFFFFFFYHFEFLPTQETNSGFLSFRQLITNYRNGSADGLSLPFLTNWLLGDIANLLGCILTNQ